MKRPAIWLALVCAACGTGVDPDEDIGGKEDRAGVVEHGSFELGQSQEITLAAGARHDWTFTLSDDAQVTLYTRPVEVDTVLYIYKRSESGWGRYIAKNDDHEGDPAAYLRRDLGAGEYLVRLKGGDEDVKGKLRLASDCYGDGCPPGALDYVEAGDCVGQAVECAMEGLDGKLTLTQARARFDGCLAGKRSRNAGSLCEAACAYEGAEALCAATADAISFYSGKSGACRTLFTECLPACYYADGNIQIYDAIDNTPEGMCIEYGVPANCDTWSRSRTECGGDRSKSDCMDRCLATEGPWMGGDEAISRETCEEMCADG